jgi:hypothetical protein
VHCKLVQVLQLVKHHLQLLEHSKHLPVVRKNPEKHEMHAVLVQALQLGKQLKQ